MRCEEWGGKKTEEVIASRGSERQAEKWRKRAENGERNK